MAVGNGGWAIRRKSSILPIGPCTIRYPGDFDGVIARALANRHVLMHTHRTLLEIGLTLNPDERITQDVAERIDSAVMAQCDTLDEGFLNNPRQCSIDFASLSPANTIHYYESVLEEMGSGQEDWMRLFLAPGMGHCAGGPGVNTFETNG